MTIDEILSQITILKDCTTANSFGYFLAAGGALVAVLFIWKFIDDFYLSSVGGQIVKILFALVGILGIVIGIFSVIKRPVFIDYYISINDVEIEQIREYFDIGELSQVNDMTVCRITPKSEYYDEIVEAWKTSIRKETTI